MKRSLLYICLTITLLFITGCSSDKKGDPVVFHASKNTDRIDRRDSPDITTIPDINVPDNVTPIVTGAPDNYNTPDTSMLYPVYERVNEEIKYGYIDYTGQYAIQPIYEFAGDYNDGVAVVRMDGNMQVIDLNGNIIFESLYNINDFSNGLAAFTDLTSDGYRDGYIDTNGNIVIAPEYEYASNFHNDIAYVTYGDGLIHKLDTSGNIIETYNPNYEIWNLSDIQDDYYIFFNSETWRSGVINLNNEIVLEPIYSTIEYLGNDLFAVKYPNEEDYYDTITPFKIIDKYGTEITTADYYKVHKFDNRLASVSDDTHTYFIDTDGFMAYELPKLEGMGSLKLLGDTIKAEIDSRLIYMNKDGHIIWEKDYTTYLDGGIRVTSNKFKPNRLTLIYYPQVEGLEGTAQALINTRLYSLFTREGESFAIENAVEISDDFNVSLDRDILVINRSGYDYPIGAAHGMPLNDYYFFNIKTGQEYLLKDLFKENSNFVSWLNLTIEQMMDERREDPEGVPYDEFFTGITDQHTFYLTYNSLVIYFYPYEIASYAAGFQEFEIPYMNIVDLIDTPGEFWNSFWHIEFSLLNARTDNDKLEMLGVLISHYLKASALAGNINDIDYVADHILEGSPIYNYELSHTLEDDYYEGEEYISSIAESFEYNADNDTYLVDVIETIQKNNEIGKRENQTYNKVYTIGPDIDSRRYVIYSFETR